MKDHYTLNIKKSTAHFLLINILWVIISTVCYFGYLKQEFTLLFKNPHYSYEAIPPTALSFILITTFWYVIGKFSKIIIQPNVHSLFFAGLIISWSIGLLFYNAKGCVWTFIIMMIYVMIVSITEEKPWFSDER